MKRRKKIIGCLLLALVLFFLGDKSLNAWYESNNRQVEAKAGEEGWVDVKTIIPQDPKARAEAADKDRQLFFLLAGVDWDQDNPENEHTRSDTLMLVKVDFANGRVQLVSLPRDSYVSVEGKMTKLTHAHYYGGIELTLQTIRDWLGLDVKNYAEVNYQAVQRIVDGMGGIEYTIPDDGIEYRIFNTHYVYSTLQPGEQTLDGEQALGYLRFRKGYAEGDIGRVKAQQKFLRSFVDQVLSADQISLLPSLIQTVFSDVKTNIPWTTIVSMMGNLDELKGAKLETSTLPGQGKYMRGVSYYVTDPQGVQQMIEENFGEYLLSSEAKAEEKP